MRAPLGWGLELMLGPIRCNEVCVPRVFRATGSLGGHREICLRGQRAELVHSGRATHHSEPIIANVNEWREDRRRAAGTHD